MTPTHDPEKSEHVPCLVFRAAAHHPAGQGMPATSASRAPISNRPLPSPEPPACTPMQATAHGGNTISTHYRIRTLPKIANITSIRTTSGQAVRKNMAAMGVASRVSLTLSDLSHDSRAPGRQRTSAVHHPPCSTSHEAQCCPKHDPEPFYAAPVTGQPAETVSWTAARQPGRVHFYRLEPINDGRTRNATRATNDGATCTSRVFQHTAKDSQRQPLGAPASVLQTHTRKTRKKIMNAISIPATVSASLRLLLRTSRVPSRARCP